MLENWTIEHGQEYLEAQAALVWVNDLNAAHFDGHIDSLKAYAMLHRLKAAVDGVMKALIDKAIDEAEKYPEKTFTAYGYEVTKKSGSGRWDFKHLEDWKIKVTELESIEEQHKAAFKMAERGDTYISNGGEVIEPAIYTPGRSTISLKPIL